MLQCIEKEDRMPKILAVCLSATIQRTITFRDVELERVNRSEKYRIDASGKAVNSARVLNQLEPGSAVTVCPLGEKNAAQFMELASRDGLEVIAVKTPGYTRECWTLLDRVHGTTTELVVSEPVADCEYPVQEHALLQAVDGCMKDVDAVLMAGSRPGIWSEGIMAFIARLAVESGKVLLADYHGEDLERTLASCTPDIIKINDEEFCGTFSLPRYLPDEALTEAVCAQSRKLGNIIVVTRGTRPTIGADKGEAAVFPCETVHAVNTTACGDSFSAGFLYEYLETHDFNAALAKGTWCAARNAERECPGTVRD